MSVGPTPTPAPAPSPLATVPSVVVVVLGLIGGVLQYLNQQTFGFILPWRQVITFGLFLIPLLGVTILTGPAFRTALHLSTPVVTAIGVGMTLLAAAVTTFGLSGVVQGVIEAVLTFLAFVGFSPIPSPVVFLPTPVAIAQLTHRGR